MVSDDEERIAPLAFLGQTLVGLERVSVTAERADGRLASGLLAATMAFAKLGVLRGGPSWTMALKVPQAGSAAM